MRGDAAGLPHSDGCVSAERPICGVLKHRGFHFSLRRYFTHMCGTLVFGRGLCEVSQNKISNNTRPDCKGDKPKRHQRLHFRVDIRGLKGLVQFQRKKWFLFPRRLQIWRMRARPMPSMSSCCLAPRNSPSCQPAARFTRRWTTRPP